jgi:hypothetical protein
VLRCTLTRHNAVLLSQCLLEIQIHIKCYRLRLADFKRVGCPVSSTVQAAYEIALHMFEFLKHFASDIVNFAESIMAFDFGIGFMHRYP